MMMTEDNTMKEMPKYRSHKIIHALKIKTIEFCNLNKENKDTDEGAYITPEEKGFVVFRVDRDFVEKRITLPLPHGDCGYYVVYDDGYKSWSPTKAFEEGYDRI